MTNIEKLQQEFSNYCKENKLEYSHEQEEMDLMYKFFDHKLQTEQTRIAEEVEKLGDIWKLEATAEETESGCPRFTRINRDVLSIIKQGK